MNINEEINNLFEKDILKLPDHSSKKKPSLSRKDLKYFDKSLYPFGKAEEVPKKRNSNEKDENFYTEFLKKMQEDDDNTGRYNKNSISFFPKNFDTNTNNSCNPTNQGYTFSINGQIVGQTKKTTHGSQGKPGKLKKEKSQNIKHHLMPTKTMKFGGNHSPNKNNHFDSSGGGKNDSKNFISHLIHSNGRNNFVKKTTCQENSSLLLRLNDKNNLASHRHSCQDFQIHNSSFNILNKNGIVRKVEPNEIYKVERTEDFEVEKCNNGAKNIINNIIFNSDAAGNTKKDEGVQVSIVPHKRRSSFLCCL